MIKSSTAYTALPQRHFQDVIIWYTANVVNISVYGVLSIGSGLTGYRDDI